MPLRLHAGQHWGVAGVQGTTCAPVLRLCVTLRLPEANPGTALRYAASPQLSDVASCDSDAMASVDGMDDARHVAHTVEVQHNVTTGKLFVGVCYSAMCCCKGLDYPSSSCCGDRHLVYAVMHIPPDGCTDKLKLPQ